MEEGFESLVSIPGGFVEASAVTDTTEIMYVDKIPYYQKMCEEYGYDLRLVLIYGGSDVYHHIDAATSLRTRLAFWNLPAPLAYPSNPISTTNIATRVIQINNLSSDLQTIKSFLTNVFKKDIVDLNHRKIMRYTKNLRILSKL